MRTLLVLLSVFCFEVAFACWSWTPRYWHYWSGTNDNDVWSHRENFINFNGYFFLVLAVVCIIGYVYESSKNVSN